MFLGFLSGHLGQLVATKSAQATLATWISRYGYAGIFSLLALGIVGLPVPDETLLTLAGLLVSRGELRYLPAVVSAASGTMLGITLSYVLGRFFGNLLFRRPRRFLPGNQAALEKARSWFERHGKWVLTVGYFIPGIRHFVALVAGSSKLPVRTFTTFAYMGAVLWSATFISSGYYLGSNGESLLKIVVRHIHMAALLLLLGVVAYLALRTLTRRHASHG